MLEVTICCGSNRSGTDNRGNTIVEVAVLVLGLLGVAAEVEVA